MRLTLALRSRGFLHPICLLQFSVPPPGWCEAKIKIKNMAAKQPTIDSIPSATQHVQGLEEILLTTVNGEEGLLHREIWGRRTQTDASCRTLELKDPFHVNNHQSTLLSTRHHPNTNQGDIETNQMSRLKHRSHFCITNPDLLDTFPALSGTWQFPGDVSMRSDRQDLTKPL